MTHFSQGPLTPEDLAVSGVAGKRGQGQSGETLASQRRGSSRPVSQFQQQHVASRGVFRRTNICKQPYGRAAGAHGSPPSPRQAELEIRLDPATFDHTRPSRLQLVAPDTRARMLGSPEYLRRSAAPEGLTVTNIEALRSAAQSLQDRKCRNSQERERGMRSGRGRVVD